VTSVALGLSHLGEVRERAPLPIIMSAANGGFPIASSMV